MRSVDKLGKSLEKIDKSVVAINKQFGNLTKSLKGVGTEFKQIAKAAKELAKNTATSRSSLDPKALSRSAIGLRKIKLLLRDLKSTSSLLDTDQRKFPAFNNAATELSNFVKKIQTSNKALATNEAILKRQIAALATVANNTRIGGDLYVKSVQAQTRAEQNLRLAQLKRVESQSKLYGTGGGDTPTSFKGNKQLLGMEGQIANNIASLSIYRGELQKALTLVDMSSNEYKEIDKVINRINERLNATNSLKEEELAKTKETEKAERNRLKNQKNIFTQTANIGKRMRGDMQTLLGIGKLNLDVFSGRGKGGWLNQNAHIIGVADAIQRVIKRMNLLQTSWGRNTKAIAQFVQRGVEGFTALRIGAIGLNTILGGADWVIGAVKGFAQFESAAANVIWSIERNYQSAFTSIGRLVRQLPEIAAAAAYAMPQVFGGPGLAWDAMRPNDKEIDRVIDNIAGDRLSQRRPSRVQRMEGIVARGSRRLAALNPEDGRYAGLKKEILNWEFKITQEKAKQLEIAGLLVGKVSRAEQAAARRSLSLKKQATLQANKEIEARHKLLQQRASEAVYLPGRGRRIENDPSGRRSDYVNRRVWERYQRMKSSRASRIERRQMDARAQRSRMGENLMLGAGFPLLFGGGLGSVGGGVAGAALTGGGKGFGAQILLSALGQQIDAFVMKTAELGKAFNEVTPNVDGLIEAMGVSGTALGEQMKAYAAVAEKEDALKMATEQMALIIGTQGVKNLKEFGDAANRWGNDFSQTMLRIQSAVAGFFNWASKLPFMKQLSGTSGAGPDFDKGLRKRTYLTMRGGKNEVMNDIKAQMRQVQRDPVEKWGGRGEGKAVELERLMELADAEQRRIEQGQRRVLMEKTVGKKVKDRIKDMEYERQILENTLEYGTREGAIQSEISAIVRDILKDKETITQKQREQIENEVRLKFAAQEAAEAFQKISITIKDGVLTAIEGAIKGTKTLGDVATSVFSDIASQLLKLGMTELLSHIPGIGKIFKAEGGPVSGGSPYIVGEKGPELFVPNSSGNIVPNHAMGGSMVINVDASGSSAEGDSDRSRQLGELIGAAVQSEIIRQQRPGGTLY